MTVSSGIAVAGIAIAFFIWVMRKELAAGLAATFGPIYRLLLNKYYVDELYDAPVVHPLGAVSRDGLWRGVDVGVIDGAVNGVGTVVDAGAATLRRLQTGSIRTYASSLFVGVVVMLGYCCGDGGMPCWPAWGLPLAGALLLLVIGNADGRRDSLFRWLALAISVAEFALTLAIWMAFDPGSAEFQFVERVPWIPAFGIDYYVGIDGIQPAAGGADRLPDAGALLSSWEGAWTRRSRSSRSSSSRSRRR